MPPASTSALVLLDVDGVLNAVSAWGRSDAWDDWRTGLATAEGRQFTITWSPSVVRAVRAWHEIADVRWLTTWGHDANTSLRFLLELPELPVAGTYDELPGDETTEGDPDPAGRSHASVAPAAPDRLTGRWWKFDVVRRIVRAEPDRRIAWLDDDLAGQDDVREWMRSHTRALLVAPDLRSGLTPDHLAAVQDFLRG